MKYFLVGSLFSHLYAQAGFVAMRRASILLNYKYNVVQWDLWDDNEKKHANFNKTRGLIGPLLVTKNQNIIPRTISSCSPHFYLRKGTSLSLSLSLSPSSHPHLALSISLFTSPPPPSPLWSVSYSLYRSHFPN